jgi:hypothetical protein
MTDAFCCWRSTRSAEIRVSRDDHACLRAGEVEDRCVFRVGPPAIPDIDSATAIKSMLPVRGFRVGLPPTEDYPAREMTY